ncbi:MAG TPA: ATP-binding protein, partial [bacterium]|nr:ATP-binding protein [bacterium]
GALTHALQRMAEQLHERLRNESRQLNELEAIFASMVDAVMVVDTDECVVRFNHAATRLFHKGVAEISGRSILEVVRNTQLHQFIRKTLVRSTPQEEEIVIHNTEDRYLRVIGTAIEEGEGRVTGALIVLQDLTRIHKLERIRRDFVANVSHELKTPITAVKGFVETLLEGAIENPETAMRFLDIILKHTNQLNAVIEDLLSLSRIEQETGNGGIRMQSGRLLDVIQSALAVCRKRADEHEITFRVDCDPDLMINMHRTLLQQALVNLVDNALKYGSDHSEVALIVETDEARVRIHVRDQGPGIAAEHLDRLFERFYRVDKSRSRDMGGSGLGLAIVKHIVQAHRGKIFVRSTVGKGSDFEIALPRYFEDPKTRP